MLRQWMSFFRAFPERFDRWLRWRDLALHRIDETWLHRKKLIEGYSPLFVWLTLLTLGLMLWGVPAWRDGWLPLIFVVAIVALFAGCRLHRRQGLAYWSLILLTLCGVAGWLLGGADGREAEGEPYRHLLQGLVPVAMLLAIVINRWWAAGLFASLRGPARDILAPHLHGTQLFVRSTPTKHDKARVLRAFALVPIASPLLLALLVGLVVLALPGAWIRLWIVALIVAAGIVLLGFAHYHRRLTTFRDMAEQAFLVGGPLAVSGLVIVLAALRIAGVDYVTTVVDLWQTRLVLGYWIASGYVLFWLYTYWTERAVSEVLLGLLDTSDPPQKRPYSVGYRQTAHLQIHGGGRFLAIEPNEDDPRRPHKFHAHRPLDVFRRVADRLMAEARVHRRDEQHDERWDLAHRADQLVFDLAQRKRLYHSVPAGVLGAIIFALVLAHGKPIQHPLVTAAASVAVDAGAADTAPFDLVEAWRNVPSGGPAIFLAASGGGTRAALYTYAVLRGLREQQALDRLIAASAVSGGSVAVAYFAAHRGTLCAGAEADWQRYQDALAAPHIRNVLAGVGETRLLSGTRLGHLLAESLERQFAPRGKATLGDAASSSCGPAARGFGVILNAALTGSGPFAADGSPPRPGDGSSAPAGGRLAMTNVRGFTSAAAASPVAGWPLDLPFVVIGDASLRLNQAGAASANFPPIFPNAAIDLGQRTRYWITDGGAVENRGLISLLLALRSVLEPMSEPERLALPPAKILVAEASGFSTGYQDLRGAGALGSASRQLASKLIAELTREVGALAEVEIAYLPMPDALRISGSFGTHWMMPSSIRVSPPDCHDPDGKPRFEGDDPVGLGRDQILGVVDRLFARDRSSVPGLDEVEEKRLWRWLSCPHDPTDVLERAVR